MKKKERNKIQITDSATIGDLIEMARAFRKKSNKISKSKRNKIKIKSKDLALIERALESKIESLHEQFEEETREVHPALDYEILLIKIDKLQLSSL